MITFDALRKANIERLPVFKNKLGGFAHSAMDGSDWSLAEWTNAIAGECGEACNLAKKMIRGDFGNEGTPGYRMALLELKELADIVCYADITATRCGGSLGGAVQHKFNEVSDRVGVDIKL